MEPWLTGSWVLEYVGDGENGADGIDGLVVRRNWLLLPKPEDEREAVSWDGSIRVEQLLVSCRSLSPPRLICWHAVFSTIIA